MGNCAVITNEEKNYKMMIISDCLSPKAIVDPDLLVALPPKIAASTAIDALTHAIESYTCLRANPVTDVSQYSCHKINCPEWTSGYHEQL